MSDELIPLSEIADIAGGFAFKSEDFGTFGFPVVKIANIEPPRVNLKEGERISPEKVQGLERFCLRDRDVVMAMTGATIGKVGRVRSSEPAYINQRVAKISAKAGREFDDFIFAVVSQADFDEHVLNNANGSAQANISTDGIGRILIPAFPPDEQIQIGSIIAALDDKIELNRRMNETLEAMARALFQNWFVDATQAGLPKGWREGKMSDLATLSRDDLNPGEFSDETFDHYSIPAFDEGQTPKPETGDAIKSNKFIVPPDCVLVSKLNPRIPRIWLPDLRSPNRAICSTEFLVTTPKPGVSREFIFCLFTNEEFANVLTTMVTGTSGSHQRVKPESLLGMDTVLPPPSLIQSFTEKTAPLLKRINHNIAESRTLAAMRDALLPKLLSGELRLPAAAKLLEAHA